jgi:hypothetical protein
MYIYSSIFLSNGCANNLSFIFFADTLPHRITAVLSTTAPLNGSNAYISNSSTVFVTELKEEYKV